jgi:hypothetical protein
MKRLPYSATLVSMATAIYNKTLQQRSVSIVELRGRVYVSRGLRGEALPILRQQRYWL